MSNIFNIKLGPCSVVFGGQDLGFTQGGVEVTLKRDLDRREVPQLGESAIETLVKLQSISAKVVLAESDVEKLNSVMPGSTLVIDAAYPDRKKLVVGTGIGVDLRQAPLKLVLHPVSRPTEDVSEDLTIWAAAPDANITFAFKTDQERNYGVVFTGYRDVVTGLVFSVGWTNAADYYPNSGMLLDFKRGVYWD